MNRIHLLWSLEVVYVLWQKAYASRTAKCVCVVVYSTNDITGYMH